MFNMRPYSSLREEGYVFMLIVIYGYVLLIIDIDDEYDY